MAREMKVSVIGAGYVGLVSAVGFAELGHRVICVDIDPRRLAAVRLGCAPFHEPGLDRLLKKHSARKLSASSDLVKAVCETDVTLIAVGTPFGKKGMNLDFVRTACQGVGRALRRKKGYHVVIVKSTVVPGTSEDLVVPEIEKASGKRVGRHFGVVSNPEFLREGQAVADFMDPDRIIIGGREARARLIVRKLYAPFRSVPVVETDACTAETIKITMNALLATAVSFSNEIADVCAGSGADSAEVMRGVHLDRRLGTGGRPCGFTAYLKAGCGFGGSCLPKDLRAFEAFARSKGRRPDLVQAVLRVNARRADELLRLLAKRCPGLRGTRIAVLGLAFKAGTDDIRESPAQAVLKKLSARGARVSAFDPAATSAARASWPIRGVTYCDSMKSVLRGARAVILVTAWPEFGKLRHLLRHSSTAVIDGRRFFDKSDFKRYEGIGL